MKNLKLLGVLLLITSCGAIVNYDYETTTDFTQYKTYSYFDDMKTGLSQFDSLRLTTAIDAKLAMMGLARSENPDFYIDIQSQEVMNRNNPNIGVGAGGGGGGGFGGVSVGIPIGTNKNTREIIIDFVDKKQNDRLFWQAVSESTYRTNGSVENREATLTKLVEKIFYEYPPEK
ncbi:MAG: DUF4136 domain-containing protein [Winogradskyella sp.]|uniref:DUF4136 domain-containing protein n=1 Tax=Winogradskyella sp. TaxID=1883156 RepID=UPI003859FC72